MCVDMRQGHTSSPQFRSDCGTENYDPALIDATSRTQQVSIEWFDVAPLTTRLQASETRDIVEKLVKRGHVTHQNAHEIVLRGILPPGAREPDRDIGNDTQVAAKIMRRLRPQIAALPPIT
jgi:hypothetical protein